MRENKISEKLRKMFYLSKIVLKIIVNIVLEYKFNV